MAKKQNIILFVGPYFPEALSSVRDLEKHLKRKFRSAFLFDKKVKIESPEIKNKIDYILTVDTKKMAEVEKTVRAIKHEVLVVNCRSVFYMPLYAKLIALFPHLVMPTKDSIQWCQNKLMMRRKFRRNYPEITPHYMPVHGATKEDVEIVKKRVGFPCIVKPASLAASRLVAVCYHKEELQATLRKTFRGIKSAYKDTGQVLKPEVVVEQFLEGTMYSIDSYVDQMGNVKHLPAVYVKTGQDIGVDDFFNYRMFTPTKLSEEEEKKAQNMADKAIESLGLRSVMTHMELIKLEDGWRVLEVDARMGGHRDQMYRDAFNIPHGMNDILTRMGEKPVIRKKIKNYTATMNIFPKKKGIIKSIKGLKKVRELKSLKKLIIKKKVGQRAGLSKDGFNKVLDITLVNKSREDLLADIRRLEKTIVIEN